MEKRMHNSGFTLIEMCFVLSIITILMVCIPTISHRFDNFQLHCEVNRIVSLLLRAKNEAIRKRVTIMVEVHNMPHAALSDSFQQLNFDEFSKLMQVLRGE